MPLTGEGPRGLGHGFLSRGTQLVCLGLAFAATLGCVRRVGEDAEEQVTRWQSSGVPLCAKAGVDARDRRGTYLRAVRWNQLEGGVAKRDRYGLEIVFLLLVKGTPLGTAGCALDWIPAVTGAPGGLQKFTTWKQGISGSGHPLPEGIYHIGDLTWARKTRTVASGVSSPGGALWPQGFPVGDLQARTGNPGLGPFMSSLTPQRSQGFMAGGQRGGFFLHADVNELDGSPGTVGCLAFERAETNKYLCWLRHYRPRTLVADWGLGSVNGGARAQILDESLVETGPTGFPCAQPEPLVSTSW